MYIFQAMYILVSLYYWYFGYDAGTTVTETLFTGAIAGENAGENK